MNEDVIRDGEFEFRLREDAAETVSFTIPNSAMLSLAKMAKYREMSCEALARHYLGEGLRADLHRYFSDQVLNAVEDALGRRYGPDEAAEVLSRVRSEFRPGSADPRPRFLTSGDDRNDTGSETSFT